jgi:hypothetical protein
MFMGQLLMDGSDPHFDAESIATHNPSWDLEKDDVQADPVTLPGKADTAGGMSEEYTQLLHRGSGGSMYTRKAHATREAPMRDQG